MTPLELQDELVEEISRILAGCTYKTSKGNSIPINVFPQALPICEADEEEDPFPYIIVRLRSGEDEGGGDSFNTVSVIVIVGMWDNDLSAQGHRDVMNVIQKIYQRFQANPDLNRKAVYAGDFQWALDEDPEYPYSFGACYMKFCIAAIRREDEFA